MERGARAIARGWLSLAARSGAKLRLKLFSTNCIGPVHKLDPQAKATLQGLGTPPRHFFLKNFLKEVIHNQKEPF